MIQDNITPESEAMANETQALYAAMRDHVGRELTKQEKLTIADDVRRKHGYSSYYSTPLPGITQEFMAALHSFEANVIQRVSVNEDNSLARWLSDYDLSSYGIGTERGGVIAENGWGGIKYESTDTIAKTGEDVGEAAGAVVSGVADAAVNAAGGGIGGLLKSFSVQTWLLIGVAGFVAYKVYFKK